MIVLQDNHIGRAADSYPAEVGSANEIGRSAGRSGNGLRYGVVEVEGVAKGVREIVGAAGDGAGLVSSNAAAHLHRDAADDEIPVAKSGRGHGVRDKDDAVGGARKYQ